MAENSFYDGQDGQEQDQQKLSSWEIIAASNSPQELCQTWLNLLAQQFNAIAVGLVLLKNPMDGAYVPAAFWPNPDTDATPLIAAAQQALEQRQGVEIFLPPAPDGMAKMASQTHIAIPLETSKELHGVIVLGIAASEQQLLRQIRRQMLWGTAWLTQFFYREQERLSQTSLARIGQVLDFALLALQKKDFQESAITLVNEMAVRLGMRRVSLGIMKNDEIQVRAVSHTAHFKRQSESIQLLERAMEEAFDQRRDLAYPPAEGSRKKDPVMALDHEQLARQQGIGGIASFLMSSHGQAFGVLTLEADSMGASERQLGEVCAKLMGPLLEQKLELDHWVTGKAKFKFQVWLENLLGPSRPAFKLKVISAALLLAFLGFAEGEFRVSAKTVIEGLVQRQMVAPFQGYILQASVRAGDTVSAGQVLASLDDKDLRLEQVRWQSEREQTLRKYREAQAKHERAEASVLGAQLNQAEAQLNLIEEKLRRAQIRAPFDGVVVSGDLSQLQGAPVEQGKLLFEVTPLDAYRVILKVDEKDITYVRVGQLGQLVLSGLTGDKLGFSVKKTTSISTAEEGINYFRVEAQLDQPAAMIRPGMEGVGKIQAGERRLVWIWTRRLTDWLAIKLWSWLP